MSAGCVLRSENNVICNAGTESFYFCFKMYVLSTDVQSPQLGPILRRITSPSPEQTEMSI